jgi:chemotaxis protein methyltransferase CheR
VTFASPFRAARVIPPFGYGDYLRFSKLVHDRYGLHFSEKRRDDLERGVRQAFATSTCTDLNEYYRVLQDPDSSVVHFERLVNALTISETHFFRDAGQVDAMYDHVFPQLIKRRRALRTLRIWSAGCASGEEPYSIAMLLHELLPDVDEWSITILGTDINTEALERARQAVYSEWAFREERAKQWRPRYFHRRGNHYELIPTVQRMVTFGQFNLVEDEYPSYESNTTLMDLILCRNVMIYFTEPISRRIVERFYGCLTYGGWLVVGHAEHSLTIYRHFQVHNFPNAILYQRGGKPTPQPRDQEWLAPLVEEKVPPAFAVPVSVSTDPSAPEILPTDVCPALAVEAERGVRAPEPETETEAEPELEKEEAGSNQVYIHALGRLGHVDPSERAKELLSYGHSEEARDLLLDLVKAGTPHASMCALLGQVYANLGHWEKAEHWCRQAVRLDVLALDAYYILALVFQHRGRLDEAIGAMKKVVYIDRHYVLGHFGLADLYRDNGQLPQALKSLDNARRLLDGCAEDEFIPGSGGITAGSLQEAIIHQQQKWGAEAAGL